MVLRKNNRSLYLLVSHEQKFMLRSRFQTMFICDNYPQENQIRDLDAFSLITPFFTIHDLTMDNN